MPEIKNLSVINAKELLSLEVDPPKFFISRFMPVGLHMLAGSPKIGKSWLALWLCNQISYGEKVWEFDTLKCNTLYISLEDTIDRLHFRLSRITENGSEQSLFATKADSLSGTLIAQLEAFMKEYPGTGVIVIDTFQRIREGANEKGAYANDYEEINRIKAIADKYKIAILLVHHLRKMPDSDPFNMVSGSTGIIGAVDSIYVLEKDNRTDSKAKLHITGRDIEDMQLLLEFDRHNAVWKFVSYLTGAEKTDERLIATLIAFLTDRKEFTGTATQLLSGLKEFDGSITLKPNALTRVLKETALTLEKSYNITVTFKRQNTARLISLSVVSAIGDGDSENTHGGTEIISSPEKKSSDGDGENICGGKAKPSSRKRKKSDDAPTV